MGLHETINALLRNPDVPMEVIRDAILEYGDPNVAKVYIVCGNTGTYSGFRIWDVAAFLLEEHAQKFCDELNAWCKSKGVDQGSEGRISHSLRRLTNPLDPNYGCDSNGVRYGVSELPLRVE